MASGIRDKVAILGMGCSRFGERWDADPPELMVEAFEECIADAGIEKDQIDAAWFSSAIDAVNVGPSALPLSVALRLPYIPVTRVENMCASGTEAFRGAVYAVASGAADIALALGCEKLKDTGYGGLPQRSRGTTNDMTMPNLSAPAASPSSPPATEGSMGWSATISSAPWRGSRSRVTPMALRIPRRICGARSPRSRREGADDCRADRDFSTVVVSVTAPLAPWLPPPRSHADSANRTWSRSRRCSSASPTAPSPGMPPGMARI